MPYTVWLCTSPSTGEQVRAVRASEVDDYRHQHEYQRIVWRGTATSRAAALELATLESGK